MPFSSATAARIALEFADRLNQSPTTANYLKQMNEIENLVRYELVLFSP